MIVKESIIFILKNENYKYFKTNIIYLNESGFKMEEIIDVTD